VTSPVEFWPGAIANPSEKSVVGLAAVRTVPASGFDLVMINGDPPLLLKRMVTASWVRPDEEPISIWVVQPSAGTAQSGIESQPPSLVDLSRSATGAVSPDPVKMM
jgi:hypothetical protein